MPDMNSASQKEHFNYSVSSCSDALRCKATRRLNESGKFCVALVTTITNTKGLHLFIIKMALVKETLRGAKTKRQGRQAAASHPELFVSARCKRDSYSQPQKPTTLATTMLCCQQTQVGQRGGWVLACSFSSQTKSQWRVERRETEREREQGNADEDNGTVSAWLSVSWLVQISWQYILCRPSSSAIISHFV